MKIAFNIVLLFCFAAFSQKPNNNTDKIDFYIGEITLIGNKKTKDFIIRREMDLSEGKTVPNQIFNEAIEKNRNRIFNTGLFVNVQISVDSTLKTNTKLYVLVTERWYTIPNIVFELADRSFNEWWYQRNKDLKRVNYGLGLTQHNIRGRNETIKLNAQGGFTRNISGSYSIPYINKSRTLGITFGIGYSENKQVLLNSKDNKQIFYKSEHILFNRTYFYISSSYRKSFFTTHKATLDFNSYYANDSVLLKNTKFFSTNNTHTYLNTFTYNLIHDKRNIQAYATKGHLSTVDLKFTGLLPNDYYRNTQVSISHARFYDLGHKWYLASKTKILLSASDRIPYYNLKTLGYGNDYIRGYDLYVVDASSYFYNKINLKRKLIQYQVNLGNLMPLNQFRSFPVSIYLNTYADLGYGYKKNFDPSNANLLNRSLEGYGLGIDIVTAYDVVLRTEYSFNELGEHRLFFYVSTDVSF